MYESQLEFRPTPRAAVIAVAAAAILTASPALAGKKTPPPTFTSPPTDFVNVDHLIPLGNVSPGSDHVIPVDHTYLGYPIPDNNGADVYPLYAMADGEIVMLMKQQVPGRPDFDYDIFIRHTNRFTSRYIHAHGLSQTVLDHLDSNGPAPWVAIGPPGNEMIFLGQLGAPDPLPVAAGEQVGVTKSYSSSWDIGIIDKGVRRKTAGRPAKRYPTFTKLIREMGLDIQAPYKGNRFKNAGCFLDYMEEPMRSQWEALLISMPRGCGSNSWDVKKTLRGVWFNPAIDVADPYPWMFLEQAALSITPWNESPDDTLQVGIAAGGPWSGIDPNGDHPQLDSKFLVTMDPSPGARINPDPALVTPATGTVCYDISYIDGGTMYNTLQLNLSGKKRLEIRYDPTPQVSPACGPGLLTEPDGTWTTTYVR